MRIVTYITGEVTPAGCEAIARFLIPGRDAKGRPIDDWHPVIIPGRSQTEAYDKARAWWDRELAKAEEKQANARAAGERLANARKAKALSETSDVVLTSGVSLSKTEAQSNG